MKASLVWYFVIGNLLANGMPHFIWGRSGVVARSPFGEQTAPSVNLAWGLANFVAGTGLVMWRTQKEAPRRRSMIALLLGFWSIVAMFGAAIRRFVNE